MANMIYFPVKISSVNLRKSQKSAGGKRTSLCVDYLIWFKKLCIKKFQASKTANIRTKIPTIIIKNQC
jgi:hypothetical protein